MKIIHEREKCIGCGACVDVCPKFWKMTDGKSIMSDKKAAYDQAKEKGELVVSEVDCYQEAANVCPVQCILIKKS